MFSIVVDIDGLVHKMDTLADNAKDLEEPLKIFGGYLRNRAIERYKAQNFAPLAQGTLEARAGKGLQQLENKLRGDLKKALKRAPRQHRSLLEKLISARPPETLTKGAASSLAKYQDFRARHRRPDKQNRFEQMAGAKDLSLKQIASMDAREGRAVQKAVTGPILGRLVRSLKVEVGSGTVTLVSRSVTQFTEIHNKGGTAGKGAKIPKRETIFIEEKDLEVLAEILKHHFTEGLEDSGT